MKTRLLVVWHWLRSSFWFVPSVLIVLSVLSATLLTRMDRWLGADRFIELTVIYSGNADGARLILSAMATSVVTIAGVVFSITIVVLSLASSQFGPRLIWNFMHDIANQTVLGTFVATFMYCLVLLGTIQESGPSAGFVPRLSVTFAFVLSVVNVGVLVYFIHHVSASIHANSVVAAVWRDLQDSIATIYPDGIGVDESRVEGRQAPPDFARGRAVHFEADGYIEAVVPETLMQAAVRADIVLRLEYRPGHFVVRGDPLAVVCPPERATDALTRELNGAFILGTQRTYEQDIEFSVHQLVEIAVRALSPGVNDPYTAVTCIDWLSAALSRLARREFPSAARYDGDGRLRVVVYPFTFTGLLSAALNQIRQAGRSNVAVSIRLLEGLAKLGPHVGPETDRAAVAEQARMILHGCDTQEARDRGDLEERYGWVVRALAR